MQYSGSEQYISERLDQYQSWYDAKSGSTKKLYLRSRVIAVLGGALVPVLTNVAAIPDSYRDACVTVIGLLVLIFVSLDSVFHWGDQWRNYRSTEQVLGREKVFFSSKTGPYLDLSEDDAYRLLVERCEEAIAVENTATLNTLAIQQKAAKDV